MLKNLYFSTTIITIFKKFKKDLLMHTTSAYKPISSPKSYQTKITDKQNQLIKSIINILDTTTNLATLREAETFNQLVEELDQLEEKKLQDTRLQTNLENKINNLQSTLEKIVNSPIETKESIEESVRVQFIYIYKLFCLLLFAKETTQKKVLNDLKNKKMELSPLYYYQSENQPDKYDYTSVLIDFAKKQIIPKTTKRKKNFLKILKENGVNLSQATMLKTIFHHAIDEQNFSLANYLLQNHKDDFKLSNYFGSFSLGDYYECHSPIEYKKYCEKYETLQK